jgi:hypothetical protein
MNSVLQALLHAPPFRDYFLSGGHSLEDCKRRTMDRLCLICDINAVFSAMYSGDRNPYSPAKFLYRSAIVFYVITFQFIVAFCVMKIVAVIYIEGI